MSVLLAGCTGAGSQQAGGSSAVRVWHWMSDREEALNELGWRYEAETGVKVRFELFAPSEVYTQRIKASAQTSTLPDIFGVLGEKRDFASFIRSGHIASLSSAMEAGDADWRGKFFPKTLDVNAFESGNEFGVEPGLYGVPIDATSIQMVYNKRLFREAGLDPDSPPKAWDDFLRVSEALKAKGIPRLVSGFGEIWMIEALASNWAMNLMGEEKVFETYRGNVPYTDADWVKVLTLFKTMADNKVLVEGAVTMVNKTAEQTFANERAAFAFNGSWCVNVYKGMNPDLEYAPMLPPLVSDAHPMKIWGGAGTSFVVNAKSPRSEEALRFLKWLTAEAQQAYLAEATANLPSNRASVKDIPPVLAGFADDLEQATHPNLYPAHEIPSVSEAFQKGIQSILIGEKSPEQIAQEVQRIKEKEQAKLRAA